jgi:glycerol-3-phosphate dehydrogenase
MRPRDLGRVASDTYDLLVVGGGIHGLTIAYEAASRGLRTALVEASDFGSGSSFNHQKTAHGGLRSLQSARIGRARQAVRERRALARIAPWFLRPLPFLVGTYRSATRNRLALRAAFRLDAWIGRHRNEGVEPELHLPAARLVSKAAILRFFPGVRQEGLTGGAQWYDYQMVESDRLTIAFAAAADRAGADIVNYAEAVHAIRANNRVAGMAVRDPLTGEQVEIRARLVVNAAGGMAGLVMRSLGVADRPLPLLKAMNLVTSKAASDIALVAPADERRMLTLVPWHGRAIVGTSQSSTPVQPHDTGVTAREVEAFIAQANRAFPALKLSRDDVTLVHRGVVPAATSRSGRAELLSETQILDHAREGADGALTVVGAKYTTAPGAARRVVTLAGRKLKRRLGPSRSDSVVLPGAGIADHEALTIETARAHGTELQLPLIRHLITRYAEHAAPIVGLMASDPRLREPLAPDRPTVAAEVAYAVRYEMAVRLSDIVIRRLGLGAAGHPGAAIVRAAATVAASELGWDASRVADEIAQVDRFYEIGD